MNIKRNFIFLLDKEKDKPDAKLRFRIKWEGNTIAFNVGFRVDIEKWSTDSQRCKNNTTHGKKKVHSSAINKEIQRFEQAVTDTFFLFEQRNTIPSIDEFRTEFNQRIGKASKSDKTFFDYYDEFMLEQGSENHWTEATFKKHRTTKKHIQNFAPKLEFSDLTEKGLSLFVDYLLSIQIDEEQTGMRNSTIKKSLGILSWYLRWATEKGYNTEMAFANYKPKLKTSEKKVIFLDWDELMTVYNFEIPEEKKYLARVRDVFCFCCFTSLRYSDVANLRRSNVKDSHIEITTVKTSDSLKIELNNYSKAIVDRYKNEVFEKDLALPVISNQKMNFFLKELGRLCKIDSQISITYHKGGIRIDEVHPKYELLGTHAGRRTFICNALMLGISPQVVMKWTGHSDYKAMKPYIDIADEAKKQAMSLFDKKGPQIAQSGD